MAPHQQPQLPSQQPRRARAGLSGAACEECRQSGPTSNATSMTSSGSSAGSPSRRRRRGGSAALTTTVAAALVCCLTCASAASVAGAAAAGVPRRPCTSSSSSGSNSRGPAFLLPPRALHRASTSSAAAAFRPQGAGAPAPPSPALSLQQRRRRLFSAATPLAAAPASAAGGTGGVGGLQMISSMFRWRNKGADGEGGDDEEVLVNIEAPAANIRRISSSIVINRPPSDVWRILTDYDNLSEYVPNLTQSRTVPKPQGSRAKVRLFQEGAQTIIGFNFKASLTMDMEEVLEGEDEKLGQRRIKFTLVDSAMFSDFSGEWRLQCYSRMPTGCETETDDWTYSTKLFYMVNVKPKGPVPVGALEWRIREDVPTNLRAVKVASEKLPWECEQDPAVLEALAASRRQQQERMTVSREWMEDETLGAYIGETSAGDSSAYMSSSGGGGGGGATAESAKAFVRVGVGSSTGGPPGGNVNMKAIRGGAMPGDRGAGSAAAAASSPSAAASSSFLDWLLTPREEGR